MNPFKRALKPDFPEDLAVKIVKRWLSSERFAHDVSQEWRLLFVTPEEVKSMCAALGLEPPAPKLDYYGFGKEKKTPRIKLKASPEKSFPHYDLGVVEAEVREQLLRAKADNYHHYTSTMENWVPGFPPLNTDLALRYSQGGQDFYIRFECVRIALPDVGVVPDIIGTGLDELTMDEIRYLERRGKAYPDEGVRSLNAVLSLRRIPPSVKTTPEQLVVLREAALAIDSLLDLVDHCDCTNGVTNPNGSLDEGDVIASMYSSDAKAVVKRLKALFE